ncbi:hypothetical protein HZS_5600, partial [Henneguya salminicola]
MISDLELYDRQIRLWGKESQKMYLIINKSDYLDRLITAKMLEFNPSSKSKISSLSEILNQDITSVSCL